MPTQTNNPLIMIVEDEAAIRRFLNASLADNNYRVNEAASAKEALSVALQYMPDLMIIDLGLPDMDGQDLLANFREWFFGPIIVLSARDQEAQKIRALDNGADDYVTKPFSPGELLARIRSLLRRKSTEQLEATQFEFGQVQVNVANRTVVRQGKDVHLTPLEYKLLLTMLHNPGKVLTHRYLLREVWGPEDSNELHYVRVFVASLRRKLEDDSARPRFILTEPSVGYRFSPNS